MKLYIWYNAFRVTTRFHNSGTVIIAATSVCRALDLYCAFVAQECITSDGYSDYAVPVASDASIFAVQPSVVYDLVGEVPESVKVIGYCSE